MASQTQGIQQLLAAEKKAAEKVAEARKRKHATISISNWTDTETKTYVFSLSTLRASRSHMISVYAQVNIDTMKNLRYCRQGKEIEASQG